MLAFCLTLDEWFYLTPVRLPKASKRFGDCILDAEGIRIQDGSAVTGAVRSFV